MSIEDKIRSILEEVDQKTSAQLSYPGATNPQDPAPYMGVGFEELEFDRPGVVTGDVQQFQFPGQTQPDPEPLAPEFEELDPYNASAEISDNVAKENYPIGSGADDVLPPQDESGAAEDDQFSKDIKPAAQPAPMVAESTDSASYTAHKAKKISAKSEGHLVILDKTTAASVEKKLGLPKGALSPASGAKYSETAVVKGADNKLHTIYAHGDKVRVRAYGHKDAESTEHLKSHLTEGLDAAPQEPTQDPVDQQNELIQQAVQAVQSGNKVEDVSKATGLDVKAIQDAIEAAQPTKSPTAPVTTAPVSEEAKPEEESFFKNKDLAKDEQLPAPPKEVKIDESELKSDVETLLAEETLSEEFKAKASSLFEAAVVARVNNEAQRLEEAFEAKYQEQVQTLQEQHIQAVEKFAEAQAERLNGYINYLGEQWIKQNRVAVQTGLRTELTEDFMSGLQKLFTEHYINVPQEKLDLVEEQKLQIEKLQESIEEMNSKVDSLEESNQSLQRDSVITKLSEGLTDTEAAKLHSLCEGIAYDSEDLFESKVDMVKKNFFKRKSIKSPEELLESTVIANQPQEDEPVQKAQVAPNMAAYVRALDRFKAHK